MSNTYIVKGIYIGNKTMEESIYEYNLIRTSNTLSVERKAIFKSLHGNRKPQKPFKWRDKECSTSAWV